MPWPPQSGRMQCEEIKKKTIPENRNDASASRIAKKNKTNWYH
jgi:hypothetical protein